MRIRHAIIVLMAGCSLIAGITARPVCAAEAAPSAGLAQAVPALFASMVRVTGYDAQGTLLTTGSGFFTTLVGADGANISAVATCRHLFAGAARVEVQRSDGRRVPIGGVLAEDVDGDLVLLAADAPAGAGIPLPAAVDDPTDSLPITISTQHLNPDDGVTISFAGAVSFNSAQVVLVTPLESLLHARLDSAVVPAFGTCYRLSTPVDPALDGCPVVSNDGELLGIAVLTLPEKGGANIVLPAARLRRLHAGAPQPPAAWAAHIPAPWLSSPEGLLFQLRGWMAAGNEAQFTRVLDGYAQSGGNATLAAFYRLFNRQDKEQPVAQFAALTKDHPDFAPAHEWLGLAYLTADPAHASTEFQQTLRLAPHSISTACLLACAYLKQGQRTQAVAALTAAQRTDANAVTVQLLLGAIALAHKQDEDALRHFTAVTKRAPRLAEGWRQAGYACLQLDRYAEALPIFKELVRLRPDDEWAISCLGASYDELDRSAEALPLLQKAVHLEPDDQWALSYLGNAYRCCARYAEALATLQQALHLQPDDAWALANLGATYVALNRFAEAVPVLEKALHLDADQQADYYSDLCYACVRLGRYADARTQARLYQRRYPDDGDAFGVLAAVSLARKQLRQAIALCRQGIRADAQADYPHTILGAAYLAQRRYAAAEQELKKAIALDDYPSDEHFYLGELYHRTGRHTRARQELAALLPLDRELANKLRKELQ